ncbi:hypothetical protein J7337_000159 [Fusarium musae]|uniref:Uncharacterized protein n=1 Tax=Fusarium musae TaxID=1042133 RepID=A0A9P8DS40_9HYPO|nr:hypothetical protein J7337_000159 [Fusarium musae]KAG9506626.1 hypothetical protein J7337_000159 [Fusarium musae]
MEWVMVKSGKSKTLRGMFVEADLTPQQAPPRARSQPPKLKGTYASEEIMRGRTLTRETDEAREKSGKSRTSDATERAQGRRPFPARLISDGEGTEHRIERAGDVMVAARRSV